MKVKSAEFIDLKAKIMETIGLFEKESDKFQFPIEDETDFLIFVDDCKVIPVFVKKIIISKLNMILHYVKLR